MPIEILMPALSPTMEEGTLSSWLKKEGDTVSSGDVIAEIETDKATMEVEAVDEGVMGKILVAEGSEGVKVNAVIALLLEEGEDASALETAPASKMIDTGSVPASPTTGGTDIPMPAPGGAGTGSAPSSAPSTGTPGGASPIDPSSAPSTQPTGAPATIPTQPKPTPPAQPYPTDPYAPQPLPPHMWPRTAGGDRIKASPLARRLAADAGLDLAAITGSGPHGRIVKRDIEGAKTAPAAAAQPAAPAAEAQAPVIDADEPLARYGISGDRYEVKKADGITKIAAKRLSDSFRDVPHFPLNVDCRIDALLKFRKELNAKAPEGVKVSVNDILIKASGLALKAVPEANASWIEDGRIAMHKHADVSVAVAIEGGLITPIIFDADQKGLAQISTEMKDLASRARARKLKPEEYQGGTFSLSNLGMFGIQSFASILNPPQGMIMSVGAGEERPVVIDGALAKATVMTVTVTCDHRVVDGATGARWIQAFKGYVEDPMTMLM